MVPTLRPNPFPPPEVLWEDNHLMAVYKPPRWPMQPDASKDPSLWDWTKAWLKEKYHKPGDAFLGLLHRLDRPASGIVLFAKTSKGASRLSAQFRERTVGKFYWAGTATPLEAPEGTLADLDPETGQPRILRYQQAFSLEASHWYRVELITGRKHQIRQQFAAQGCPLLGDSKYGSKTSLREGTIGLVAFQLQFQHPVRPERLELSLPERFWPQVLWGKPS